MQLESKFSIIQSPRDSSTDNNNSKGMRILARNQRSPHPLLPSQLLKLVMTL